MERDFGDGEVWVGSSDLPVQVEDLLSRPSERHMVSGS